ncbi:hypothetical protein evm_013346 [Chilo suppressalis]|nr:hypothetical protein evm_013346 [Chilo suppressalis]
MSFVPMIISIVIVLFIHDQTYKSQQGTLYTGVAVVRGRAARCAGAVSPPPRAHPQLYTTEPGKRNGKTLTPPDNELHEISPYATFSMAGPGSGAGAGSGSGGTGLGRATAAAQSTRARQRIRPADRGLCIHAL